MSKSTITFKINIYKLLKKYPLLKHSNKSLRYFKNLFRQIKLICRINGHQFKKILMDYFFLDSTKLKIAWKKISTFFKRRVSI